MPFPLAHPAVILPLRRYCPQRLSFASLVVGSLCPDAGYCFGIGDFSHSFFPGSFAFCLPVSLVMLVILYAIRLPAVRMLPARFKAVFLPLCQRPVTAPWLIVLSLLLGIWTHLILDSTTHEDGWGTEHLPFLLNSVPLPGTISFKGYDILYAGWTLFGVAWLAVCYWRWLETAAGHPNLTGLWIKWCCSFVFAVLILCLAAGSRGEHPLLGNSTLGVLTLLLMIAFLLGTATPLASTQVHK